ncbi:MAG TPA: hypothetical protein VGC95_00675, partial [Chitinophagaceae bacterium]
MKKSITLLSVFVLLLFAISCKKESSGSGSDNTSTEVAFQSDDQARVSNESDDAGNDAETALELSPTLTGKMASAQSIICDASVSIDSISNPRTITITYNGTNCFGNRTRTGVVKISMAQGIRWKDAGASISVTFQNLKITRLRDNKSITLNGTETHTNVTGGLLFELASLGTVTHTVTSDDMSITF